ncbi:hypothetical protein ABFA07_013815 [Porites harrisoni]
MTSLITAVFKATIGLLVNKGRDKLAEKLNEGDVTDQKFRGLIVREIDEIKSKLDGLARKDLLASSSLFKEGIEFLYEVFESARSSSEHRAITAAATACVEQFDIDGFHGDVIRLQGQKSQVLRILIYTRLKINRK